MIYGLRLTAYGLRLTAYGFRLSFGLGLVVKCWNACGFYP